MSLFSPVIASEREAIQSSKRKIWIAVSLTLLAMTLISSPAFAACSNPTAAKGSIIYNGDDDWVQYCNGADDWVGFPKATNAVNGNACSNPTGAAGDIMYNADDNVLQWCGGGIWNAAGPIGGGGGGASCPTPTTTDLETYWTLDESAGTTASDSVNNRDGTLTNGPTWNPAGGQVDGALTFDGTNDYVESSNSFGFLGTNDHEYSFSLWVKPATGETTGNILGQYASMVGWRLGAVSLVSSNVVGTSWTGSAAQATSTTSLAANTWYHVVVSWDSTNGVCVYIDGVQEDCTAAGTYSASGSSNYVALAYGMDAAAAGSTNDYFEGEIDDVRIYGRSLTTQEVADLACADTDGLVGHWTFDEGAGTTAADSGGSNDGTLTNMAPTWTTGQVGGAVTFDGANDYIDMGGSALTILDNADKTISAWVKMTSLATQQSIVDKDFDSGGNDGGWGFWTQTNGKLWWWVEGAKDLLDDGPASITAGTWTHVAVTWDASADTAKFYINGVLNSTKTDNTIVEQASGSAKLMFGDFRDGTYLFADLSYGGDMDEVRIYDRVLTDQEVEDIYDADAGVGGSCTNPTGSEADIIFNDDEDVLQYCNGTDWIGIRGNTVAWSAPAGPACTISATNLVAHLKLDESSGTTASDEQNTNDGTLQNGPVWTTSGGAIDGALDFDGTDDKLDLGTDTSLDFAANEEFTISAWVNTTDDYGPILSFRNSGNNTIIDLAVGYEGANDDPNKAMALVWDGTGSFAQVEGGVVNDGNWHLVTLTRDNTGGIELFIDGVSADTGSNTGSAGALTTDERYLGVEQEWITANYGVADQRFLDGKIDNLTIHKRVLTGTEISDMYNCGSPTAVYASCKDILNGGDSTGDGVYSIDTDSAGANAPFNVYCDMTTDGGGWTMVLAQFESDPLNNWNEGIQGDYDPDLSSSKSFTLNTAQLPAHTEIGLGKDLDPTFVDYVTGTYSTGNIAVTNLTSPASSNIYQIYRNSAAFYDYHNPEEAHQTGPSDWFNALTIDETGGRDFTWAFSPNAGGIGTTFLGYALNADYQATNESFGWTLWVR